MGSYVCQKTRSSKNMRTMSRAYLHEADVGVHTTARNGLHDAGSSIHVLLRHFQEKPLHIHTDPTRSRRRRKGKLDENKWLIFGLLV